MGAELVVALRCCAVLTVCVFLFVVRRLLLVLYLRVGFLYSFLVVLLRDGILCLRCCVFRRLRLFVFDPGLLFARSLCLS